MHLPYHHPDLIAFLQALKKEFKPDKVVCMGDEVDWHSISFHDSDPDLMSPREELKTSIHWIKVLGKIFPEMMIVESNHGSLVYRRQKAHGLPRFVIKSYKDMLEAPSKWFWVPDLTLEASNKQKIYFCHGKSADVKKLSMSMGMNAVQGHYHETFKIDFWGNPNALLWGMQTGCLFDPHSLAFAYNKVNLKRPVIGTGVIIEGIPRLVPMVLNKHGRWIGKIV